MLTNVEETDAAGLSGFDVVVVGAGFAGLETALRLRDRGSRVLVVESGREKIEKAYQELLVLDCVGRPLSGQTQFNTHLTLPVRSAGRVRAFGGNSAIWGGRWKRLDPEDFEAKPWVPYSGWPIEHSELARYYDDLEDDYELPSFDEFRNDLEGIPESIKGHGLRFSVEFAENRWPTRLRRKHLHRLRHDRDILVLLGATATEIRLSSGAASEVSSLTVTSLSGGTSRQLFAKFYVLACGGLETPRLLLACNKQVNCGIGNQGGQLGRFYIDHPKIRAGALELQAEHPAASRLQPGGRRPQFIVGFSLTPAEQAAAHCLNPSVRLVRDSPYAGLRRFVAPRKRASVVHPTFFLEQAPNPDSRLTLSDRLDPLGVPGIRLDWRLSEIDGKSLSHLAEKLSAAAARLGIGAFRYDPGELTHEAASNANHPMGTTRMAETMRTGVVDKNSRVFGTSNLFIAGSSVFPTGGNANPTYSIMCLARRLGDHILGELAARQAA